MPRKTFVAGEILTAADLNELSALTVPPGAVQAFARNTAPDGWLKANGAAVSRTTYSELFSAIGTAFGVGDGSTTFALPDLRGEFVRGWDDGRGIDSGRAFGNSQLDQMQKLTGTVGRWRGNVEGTQPTGAFTATGASEIIGSAGGTTPTSNLFDSANSPNARVSSTTSGETRPRNVSLLFCIKI